MLGKGGGVSRGGVEGIEGEWERRSDGEEGRVKEGKGGGGIQLKGGPERQEADSFWLLELIRSSLW